MSIIFNFNIVEIFGIICELYSAQVLLYWVTDVYGGLGLPPAGLIVAGPMLGIIALVMTLHSLIAVTIIPGAPLGQGGHQEHEFPTNHWCLLLIKSLTEKMQSNKATLIPLWISTITVLLPVAMLFIKIKASFL